MEVNKNLPQNVLEFLNESLVLQSLKKSENAFNFQMNQKIQFIRNNYKYVEITKQEERKYMEKMDKYNKLMETKKHEEHLITQLSRYSSLSPE